MEVKRDVPLTNKSSNVLSYSDVSHFNNDNPFTLLTSQNVNRKAKHIWAIGGGKGGVGKSLISSSLAVSLTRQRHKVIAIDLDLGGANLHTSLGVDLPKQTLNDFISGKVPELKQCIIGSGIRNLDIISGAQDSVGVTNMTFDSQLKLMKGILELEADYVILDLGAGTNISTLDFFLLADTGLIVALPEPTSIENAYRFIKSSYYRKLSTSPSIEKLWPSVQIAMDGKNQNGIRTPADLFKLTQESHPELVEEYKKVIQSISLKLVINQARTQSDVDIGHSIKSITKKYFGIQMEYIGSLDYDSCVWQAIRRKKPLFVEFPNSQIVASVEKISEYLQKLRTIPAQNLFR